MKFSRSVIVGSALLLFAAFVVLFWKYSIDDAFITFRYARNLADGYGLVFNPGGNVVEGYSNFLWLLVLVPFRLLGIAIYPAAKILGVIFTLGAASVYFLIGKKLEFDLGRLAGPLFLIAPVTAFWAVSGLELGLHTLLIALALYTYMRRSRFSWLFLSLMVVSRPEGVALALAIPIIGIFSDLSGFRQNKGYFIAALICVLGTAAALTAFRLVVFGYPLPNTYYAKQYSAPWAGEGRLLKMLLSYIAVTIGFIVATVAVVVRREFRSIILISIVLVVLQAAASTSVDPVMNFHLRYLLPVLPLMLLVIFDSLQRVASPVLRYVAVGLIAVNLLAPAHDVYGTVQREQRIIAAQEKCIAWMKKLPAGTTISMTDMGRIPFYTDKTFYDLWGLTNEETAHLGYNHVREFLRLPSYFVLVGNVQGRAVKFSFWREQAIGYQPLFQETYEPVDYFVPDGEEVTDGGYYYFVYHKRPQADSILSLYDLSRYLTQ